MRGSAYWAVVLAQACLWIVAVLAYVGAAMLHSRSVLLWAGLLVLGVLVPPFLVWVVFCLLCYFYLRFANRSKPAPWRSW